jgi:cephalosporin hydroxylase
MEEVVGLGFNFQFSIPYFPLFLMKKIQLKTFQIKSEIIGLLKMGESLKPKIILEIGTALGGTLFLLSRFSSSKALLISMDLLSDEISSRNFDFYKKLPEDVKP